MNKRKNIAAIIAAAFLFLALFDGWPYGFFTLLRFVVFFASAYIAWMSYELEKKGWTWSFVGLAVLFNPFIPIHLTRGIWVMIDVIVGIFLISSVYTLKLDASKTDSAVSGKPNHG